MVHEPIGRNLLVYQRKLKFITKIVSEIQILVKDVKHNRMCLIHDRLNELLVGLPEWFDEGRVSLKIHDANYNRMDLENFCKTLKEKRGKLVFKHVEIAETYCRES